MIQKGRAFLLVPRHYRSYWPLSIFKVKQASGCNGCVMLIKNKIGSDCAVFEEELWARILMKPYKGK